MTIINNGTIIHNISNPTEGIFENYHILDTNHGMLECIEQVAITKNGRELNCYVSFSLTDGTEFYTYESLDFARHLDRVKKFSLSLLANEIINKAEEMMAA